MRFDFDSTYVGRSALRVAMFVANGVVNDSRVIKTAQTVKKLGFDIVLFGVGKKGHVQEIRGYNFPIRLLPRVPIERLHVTSEDEAPADYEAYSAAIASQLTEVLQDFRPHVLHTHDMIGLAVGDAVGREVMSPSTRWVHDIHEYVAGLTELHESTRQFFYSVEKRCIQNPDVLTCVSPALADILQQDHRLREAPRLVLNAPRASDFDPAFSSDIRSAVGVCAGVPLLVYSGGVKPIRGIDILVRALPNIPDAHLAIITNARGDYRNQLIALAQELRVRDRVHFHEYVRFMNVTSFLRTASLGVHPIKRYPNAEIALPNKLFEYIHAGISCLVSDNTAMREFVTAHACGGVFAADDAVALADEARTLLSNCQGTDLRLVADQYSWERQEETLAQIYSELHSGGGRVHRPAAGGSGAERILHLPVAGAGQPAILVEALKRRGHQASSLRIGAHPFRYQADIELDSFDYVGEHATLFAQLLGDFDVFHYHARPASLSGAKAPAGLDLLLGRTAGKKVFFHFRGSEARMRSIFAEGCPYNFVLENPEGIFTKLTELQQKNFVMYARSVCDGIFVVDPELQTYVTDGLIVPRAIDLEKWTYVGAEPHDTLKLVHAPSRRGFKGTDRILEAVQTLQEKGVALDLTLVENMPNDEAAEAYRRADVVVDQLRIGWYGVLAVEAMALGKAVVSYVRDDLKHHLPYPFPLAIANPDNIEAVLANLARDHDLVRALGRQGRAYVEQVHDADKIAELLLEIYRTFDRPVSPTAVWRWLDQGRIVKASKPPAAQQAAALLRRGASGRLSRENVHLFFEKARSEGLLNALGKAYDVLLGNRRQQ